jgi:hypothetical protein
MNRKTTTLILTLAVLLIMPAALAAVDPDLKEARQGTASFHNIKRAEAGGYVSTLDTLGCFENPGIGGMGLHYLHEGLLLDPAVDARTPEALVYEMGSNGRLRLVGLEYIVPSVFVDPANPPELFGHRFHEHPVLPLYVLHAWVWSPNPLGMFEDWNPRVALCPDGVPVFGS